VELNDFLDFFCFGYRVYWANVAICGIAILILRGEAVVIKKSWVIIGLLFVAAVIYFLGPILLPFCLGAIIAYIFNPLVNAMEKLKCPRTISILLIFALIIIVLSLMIGVLVPILGQQILSLSGKIPIFINWVQEKINFQIDPSILKKEILQYVQMGGNLGKHVIATVMQSGKMLIEVSANIILIPIVTFYLLRDWNKITDSCIELLPPHNRQKIVGMIRDCGEVLSSFFRGQLLVMFFLAVIYSVGLTIAGLDLSLIIGIGAGLLSIVPYLGFAIGFIVALIDVLLKYSGWWHLIIVCIVFAIGHVSESYILQPWLVGQRIGLHPVAVIFAVVAGGLLFGFIGVVIALPVAAVIVVLLRHFRNYYMSGEYYNFKGEQ
jgi:predicted PurR-regulated permease PerM